MATETFTRDQVDQVVKEALVRATGLLDGQPVHLHRCSKGHTWYCNSGYCENVNSEATRDCPEHGGFKPIAKGLEPWRGGSR